MHFTLLLNGTVPDTDKGRGKVPVCELVLLTVKLFRSCFIYVFDGIVVYFHPPTRVK